MHKLSARVGDNWLVLTQLRERTWNPPSTTTAPGNSTVLVFLLMFSSPRGKVQMATDKARCRPRRRSTG